LQSKINALRLAGSKVRENMCRKFPLMDMTESLGSGGSERRVFQLRLMKQNLASGVLIPMHHEDELEWLKRQIDRYKALARQIRDDEAARLIRELVSKLEQRLHAKLN
jgi:RNA binding exosome subunit